MPDPDAALADYLNDHHAGAQAALATMSHLRDQHEGTPAARFLGELQEAVERDRLILVDLMGQLGIDEQRSKALLGTVGEKLSRVKLSALATGEDLSLLMGLDTLTSGVAGKRALWEALAALQTRDPRLTGTDFVELQARADTQREGLAEHRRSIAASALTG
jgi:hypothetical protein